MKKIAMFTMGTRGDVQPYIVLSKALSHKGYDVTLGTHPCWKELVESQGIHFVAIGPDIDIEVEASMIRGNSKNPMLSMLKTMNFVFKLIESSSDEVYLNCKDKDLIIVSHCQMGSAEAEALGLPTIHITFQTEMIAEIKKKQTIGKRIMGAMINPISVKPFNKVRKKYQLKTVKSMDQIMQNKLNLIPISCYVQKQNPYWSDNNKIVGYWFLEDEEYLPSEELKQFLELGEAPILLSLGAMAFESKEEVDKLNIFIESFKKTNKRAIIQGFKKSLVKIELPETMIAVDSIPHSWLFKQGLAVIHHCGFGTTASAIYYGIPSIPVPHVLDQMGFANQLQQLGVATKPIEASKLNLNSLIEAIQDMDHNYRKYKKEVDELSLKMHKENGLEKTIQLIEDLLQ